MLLVYNGPMTADSEYLKPQEHPTLSSLLLEDVRRMDPHGWARLVTIFGPIVYRWCRTSGIRESEAADVVQEVFAAVARGITSFERVKSEGSFRSWLATITRSRVRDHYRRSANRMDAEGGTDAMLRLQQMTQDLDSTICAENVQTLVVREVLQQVKAEFEQTTWAAFWLTTIDEIKAADVAEQTGLSVASVYQAKSRVLRRLRQRLSELPS